jgi:hypothetical protein
MLFSLLKNRLMITGLALITGVSLAVLPVASSTDSARRINYSTSGVSFQQEDGWVAIKGDDGILFAWNIRELHFTLEIKGKDIKPLNDPDHIFFTVDGMTLQIQVASIREFVPDAKEKKFDDRTILAAHRDWESKFIEGLLGTHLKVESFNAKPSNSRVASLWQFDMPQGMNADAKKQVYLTVVSNDYVLLLNSPATASTSDEAARKFLLDTMATLKISSTPIDVKKLAESIRAGSKP